MILISSWNTYLAQEWINKEELTIYYVNEQQASIDADPLMPRYSLVFDREAYSPEFFSRIWILYRVAVITYRKYAKDLWEETEFEEMQVETELGTIDMLLCEREVELNGIKIRSGQNNTIRYR